MEVISYSNFLSNQSAGKSLRSKIFQLPMLPLSFSIKTQHKGQNQIKSCCKTKAYQANLTTYHQVTPFYQYIRPQKQQKWNKSWLLRMRLGWKIGNGGGVGWENLWEVRPPNSKLNKINNFSERHITTYKEWIANKTV